MITPSASAKSLFRKHPAWLPVLAELYRVLQNSPLEETVRWGVPTWMLQGSLVVSLVAFKPYAGLWFHQGALLDDPLGVLVRPDGSSTKAQRQWRFTEGDKVSSRRVQDYLRRAILLAEKGRKVASERGRPVDVPQALARLVDADERLRAAFDALSLSKRREYAEFIAQARQEATVLRRLEKILPMIREGVGLNDRYR